jgi:hypothetical protein
MTVYVKPLSMVDAAGYQATHDDDMPVLNVDDPAGIALTVGAATATAISGGQVYTIASTESAIAFLRVGTAANQLATAVHFPVQPGATQTVRLGDGVTHIHAGSGA